MRALLAIKSCWPNIAHREASRHTWMPFVGEWGVPTFFVGEHPPTKPFADKCESLYGEADVVALHVSDTFKNIAPKVRGIMRYACADDFTHVAILDDDTYTVPARLAEVIASVGSNEIVGFQRKDAGMFGDFPYMQGAAYIVGMNVASLIAADEANDMRDGVPDDVAVGRVLQTTISFGFRHDTRFWPGPTPAAITINNHFVSTHKCPPKSCRSFPSMYAVHDAWGRSNA